MEQETKLNLYDVKIVNEYNGTKVDKDALVARITGKDESFHIFILPDHKEQWVRFGADSNTDFAQEVTQLMMESGEAEHLIKQVYDKVFGKKQEFNFNVDNGDSVYTYIPHSN